MPEGDPAPGRWGVAVSHLLILAQGVSQGGPSSVELLGAALALILGLAGAVALAWGAVWVWRRRPVRGVRGG